MFAQSSYPSVALNPDPHSRPRDASLHYANEQILAQRASVILQGGIAQREWEWPPGPSDPLRECTPQQLGGRRAGQALWAEAGAVGSPDAGRSARSVRQTDT